MMMGHVTGFILLRGKEKLQPLNIRVTTFCWGGGGGFPLLKKKKNSNADPLRCKGGKRRLVETNKPDQGKKKRGMESPAPGATSSKKTLVSGGGKKENRRNLLA